MSEGYKFIIGENVIISPRKRPRSQRSGIYSSKERVGVVVRKYNNIGKTNRYIVNTFGEFGVRVSENRLKKRPFPDIRKGDRFIYIGERCKDYKGRVYIIEEIIIKQENHPTRLLPYKLYIKPKDYPAVSFLYDNIKVISSKLRFHEEE